MFPDSEREIGDLKLKFVNQETTATWTKVDQCHNIVHRVVSPDFQAYVKQDRVSCTHNNQICGPYMETLVAKMAEILGQAEVFPPVAYVETQKRVISLKKDVGE